MTVYHLDRSTWEWVEGPAPVVARDPKLIAKGQRGFSIQMPPGWTDGKPGINYVRSGPAKGRVYWTSRAEAKEIAARYEGVSGERTRFDPD